MVSADGLGLTDEDQEGRLKGILGVMPIAQQPMADRQDHWPMAVEQDGKGRLFPVAAEPFQELAVAQVRRRLHFSQPAQVKQDGGQGSMGHGQLPPMSISSLL